MDLYDLGEMIVPNVVNDVWGMILSDWKSDKDKFLEFVENRDIVVQAGGCYGMYPMFYSFLFDTVYTWEPDPLNFYCLNENCEDNVIRFEGGLGDSVRGDWTLNHLGQAGGHFLTHYDIPDRKGRVDKAGIPGSIRMYRLDDMKLPGCDLIHLDTEGNGSVDNIIKGAMETIDKYSPVIVTEWGGGNDEGKLTKLGYVEKYIHHKDTKMDSVFVRVNR